MNYLQAKPTMDGVTPVSEEDATIIEQQQRDRDEEEHNKFVNRLVDEGRL